jgi:hypothetical protein
MFCLKDDSFMSVCLSRGYFIVWDLIFEKATSFVFGGEWGEIKEETKHTRLISNKTARGCSRFFKRRGFYSLHSTLSLLIKNQQLFSLLLERKEREIYIHYVLIASTRSCIIPRLIKSWNFKRPTVSFILIAAKALICAF